MEKINQILKTFGLLRKDDPFCRVIFTPPWYLVWLQHPLGQRGLILVFLEQKRLHTLIWLLIVSHTNSYFKNLYQFV